MFNITRVMYVFLNLKELSRLYIKMHLVLIP
jgi:hypothetical protein